MKVMTHFALWSLGLTAPETQTSDAERDCLAQYAAGKKRLVEVGVWHGVTTCRLREAMDPNGTLVGVDPYPKGRLGFSAQRVIAHREVSRVESGTMRWQLSTGVVAARMYREAGHAPVDFIFIDGDHSYHGLRCDWQAWNGLIEPNGIVALHDSRSSATRQIDNAGSATFTREVILKDRRFEVIQTVDTLTVLRRLIG